jgi:hypothetical protein
MSAIAIEDLEPTISTITQPDDDFIPPVPVDIPTGRPGLTISAVVRGPVDPPPYLMNRRCCKRTS